LPAIEDHRAGKLGERERSGELRLAVALTHAEESPVVAPTPVRQKLISTVDECLLPRSEPERLAEIVALRVDQEPLDPPADPRAERGRGVRARRAAGPLRRLRRRRHTRASGSGR